MIKKILLLLIYSLAGNLFTASFYSNGSKSNTLAIVGTKEGLLIQIQIK